MVVVLAKDSKAEAQVDPLSVDIAPLLVSRVLLLIAKVTVVIPGTFSDF